MQSFLMLVHQTQNGMLKNPFLILCFLMRRMYMNFSVFLLRLAASVFPFTSRPFLFNLTSHIFCCNEGIHGYR